MLCHNPSTSPHAVQPGRTANQPFRRPERAAREHHPVRGAMGQLEPLARRGECHRVLADDVAGRGAPKIRCCPALRGSDTPCRSYTATSASAAPRACATASPRASAVPDGASRLPPMMRLADFHVEAPRRAPRPRVRRAAAARRRRRWYWARSARECSAPPTRASPGWRRRSPWCRPGAAPAGPRRRPHAPRAVERRAELQGNRGIGERRLADRRSPGHRSGLPPSPHRAPAARSSPMRAHRRAEAPAGSPAAPAAATDPCAR